MLADFTKPPANGPNWIPNPDTKIIHNGRRKSRRIINNMDASKARGGEKICLACGETGHRRKECESYPTHRVAGGTAERCVPQRTIKKK